MWNWFWSLDAKLIYNCNSLLTFWFRIKLLFALKRKKPGTYLFETGSMHEELQDKFFCFWLWTVCEWSTYFILCLVVQDDIVCKQTNKHKMINFLPQCIIFMYDFLTYTVMNTVLRYKNQVWFHFVDLV